MKLLLALLVSLPLLASETRIGELFVIPVLSDGGELHEKIVHKCIKERGIRAVIFMEGSSANQVRIAQALQDESNRCLLTFQDAEWGVGMRLHDQEGLPKNGALSSIKNMDLLRDYGKELARQCRTHGIMGNFAPVCDVNSNPENPVLGERAFGDDPDDVAQRALAVMQGMQEGGLLTCAKHFPGHGNTKVDSHLDLPEIGKMELFPFQVLIDHGVDAVMVGHLLYPQLSQHPASLSKEITTGILREKMRFKGLIVTDSLTMNALADYYTFFERAYLALIAGADLLVVATASVEEANELIEHIIPKTIDQLEKLLPQELIEEKLKRIEKVRYQAALREKLMNSVSREYGQISGDLEGRGPLSSRSLF